MLASEVELRDLRRLVREFLKEIHYVPFESTHCDPILVDVLRKKLIHASRFRTYG
jgi:hypothetical protein